MPAVAPIPVDAHDELSRHLYEYGGMGQAGVTDTHVRRARHAYYAMLSHIDDRIGQILGALEASRLDSRHHRRHHRRPRQHAGRARSLGLAHLLRVGRTGASRVPLSCRICGEDGCRHPSRSSMCSRRLWSLPATRRLATSQVRWMAGASRMFCAETTRALHAMCWRSTAARACRRHGS